MKKDPMSLLDRALEISFPKLAAFGRTGVGVLFRPFFWLIVLIMLALRPSLVRRLRQEKPRSPDTNNDLYPLW